MSTDERMKLAEEQDGLAKAFRGMHDMEEARACTLRAESLRFHAAALRAPEAADAGAVAQPVAWRWRCHGSDVWTACDSPDDPTDGALVIEPLYATPTAAGIAALPAVALMHVRLNDGEIETRIELTDFDIWKPELSPMPLYAAPPAASADAVRAAAQAVIERWETPAWKDVLATAVYINALRAALSAPVAGADAGMRASYDDEVTAEQAGAIEKFVAPEFASGDWVEVESDALSQRPNTGAEKPWSMAEALTDEDAATVNATLAAAPQR